jgi:hypothetical protein
MTHIQFAKNGVCTGPLVRSRLAFALLLLAGIGAAVAGVSKNDLIAAGMPPGLADYASNVSSSEGNWGSVNPYGCVGAFQFCPGTYEKYFPGVSKSAFLSDPSMQVSGWLRYQANEWASASRLGMTNLIGQQVCWGGKCATITASSILKACQFGCQSLDGKLGNYLKTGDCNAAGSKDGNGVSVCQYLISGAGIPVEELTGMTEEELEALGEDGGGQEASEVPPAFLMPMSPKSGPAQVMPHGTMRSL